MDATDIHHLNAEANSFIIVREGFTIGVGHSREAVEVVLHVGDDASGDGVAWLRQCLDHSSEQGIRW